jgi:hypothetical protein
MSDRPYTNIDSAGELKSADIFASHVPSWKSETMGATDSRNLCLGASK